MIRFSKLAYFLLVSLCIHTFFKSQVSSNSLKINDGHTIWDPSTKSNGIVHYALKRVVEATNKIAVNVPTATNQSMNVAVPDNTNTTMMTMTREADADKVARMVLNAKRTEHGSPDLTFCPVLKDLAVDCASQYQQFKAANGPFADGENVPLSSLDSCYINAIDNDTAVYFYEASSKVPTSAFSSAINDWYEETDQQSNGFDFENPDPTTLEKYQHFTQMIWRRTKYLGTACSPIPMDVTVQYFPTTTAPQLQRKKVSSATTSSTMFSYTSMPPATTPGPGSPTPMNKTVRSYVCAMAFHPGGNTRRRFGAEFLDEYKRNVLPPLE